MKMKHGIDKCRVCENYLRGLDTCKYCSFEWSKDYPATQVYGFDILDINEDDYEFAHLQILDRLHFKGIECIAADVWYGDGAGFLIGCNGSPEQVADALGMHKEAVYGNLENGLVVLNLFQEKYLRGLLDE